ncbi:MAG: site-specific integrase [Candidatus Microgenomates bacterium]|jgi:site-specific recombinase XerD
MLQNSFDSTKIKFTQYLTNLGISEKSHKNYRSDLSHFTEWLILRLRSVGSYVESLSETIPFLSTNMAKEYKSFMLQNKIPAKTINRRLSTLRHLSRFLVSSQTLDTDFMNDIENISLGHRQKSSTSPIIEDYRSYLEAQKVSKSTVKNYVSDIRQFLAWVETNGQIINSDN